LTHQTGTNATPAKAGGGRSRAPAGRAIKSADAACLGRYGKRKDLIVHEREPFNVETVPVALAEGPLTATDAFYVRGHGPVPRPDPPAWRVRVHGLVERALELSLSTLREAFRERHVTATLQCAGNRRAGLVAIRDIPGEAPWGPGATGTATWTGVALADVLALAKPLPDAVHVGFEGMDLCSQASPPEHFGGSIPVDKACRPEVLLAWGMNGEPLPLVHGAPLRVVVPGYIGARSVKWLERIEVRSTPWRGYFQHVVYRLLPEDATPAPGEGMPLGLIALNADILSPADGDTVAAGPVEVRATRSRAANGTSRGSTSRSMEVRTGRRRSCSRTSAGGPGDTGGPRSRSRPGSTRSSSAPGTPRRPHSLRTRQRCGTQRAM
jgi:sulfite oxidase